MSRVGFVPGHTGKLALSRQSRTGRARIAVDGRFPEAVWSAR